MQPYYYLFSVMFITLIILLIRSLFLRKKSTPVKLYVEALRNENSGHFEKALVTYENAMKEVKKERFQDSSLRNKISDKLKVMHTLIEYKNSLHFTRL